MHKNKSTHSGHCQACGHLQKLPHDRLSKHGYKVTHGYFSGQCIGTEQLPFEISCDLVKVFIESAQKQLTSVTGFQHRLRTERTRKAWMRVRYENPKGRYYSAIYKWEVVEMVCTYRNSSDSATKYAHYTFTDSIGRVHGNSISEGYVSGPHFYDDGMADKSLDEMAELAALRANCVYAEWLEHEADSLRRYIAWQTQRVTTWKPAPLLPNDHKDKDGFKPTEPKY